MSWVDIQLVMFQIISNIYLFHLNCICIKEDIRSYILLDMYTQHFPYKRRKSINQLCHFFSIDVLLEQGQGSNSSFPYIVVHFIIHTFDPTIWRTSRTTSRWRSTQKVWATQNFIKNKKLPEGSIYSGTFLRKLQS